MLRNLKLTFAVGLLTMLSACGGGGSDAPTAKFNALSVLSNGQGIARGITSNNSKITLVYAPQIAATIASAALANPLPIVSAIEEARTLQKELVANILAAVAQISLTVTGLVLSLRALLKILVPVINKLSTICNNEDIPVTSEYTTVNAYLDTVSTINLESKFYQLYNVTQTDIDLREELILELQQQQRSLLDLLEAPSKVFVGSINETPTINQGKQGDFFLNPESRLIYGPKISDTEWGLPVNY
jgi:hypothetical protein